MNKEKVTLEAIAELIHDYEKEENYESVICKTKNICDIPTEDLDPSEIHYLFDTLNCLLYHYGMLSKNNVPEEVKVEEIDDLSLPESEEMINNIIKKIFSIMDDYAIMG